MAVRSLRTVPARANGVRTPAMIAGRRRLLRLAPHLVRPLEFTWPVYDGARVPRWKLGAGLTLYDALALFRNVGRHRRLSPSRVLEREPALRAEGLRGGARYYDAA